MPAEGHQHDDHVREHVLAALDRLTGLIGAQDMAALHEFYPAPDTVFIGSEAWEIIEGPVKLAEFFETICSQPDRFSWSWRHRSVSSMGDVAWLYADGEFIRTGAEGEDRTPYRVTGVLILVDGRWQWRQFHGAQPI
ncbi:MAG TPA: nuclear transport factor 2 family protein [Dongiaceae bacterium]|nr:nuclear transport factor 2 family protein [Dongiaceae bacterium]